MDRINKFNGWTDEISRYGYDAVIRIDRRHWRCTGIDLILIRAKIKNKQLTRFTLSFKTRRIRVTPTFKVSWLSAPVKNTLSDFYDPNVQLRTLVPLYAHRVHILCVLFDCMYVCTIYHLTKF